MRAAAAGADASPPDGVAARGVLPPASARGATVVLDCVGVDDTLALAAGSVAPGGHVAIVGMAGGTLPVRHLAFPLEATVVISSWGSRTELAEVVALARAGAIAIDVERVALEDVPSAYERLEAGDVRGRLVAIPGHGGGAGHA